MIFLLYALLVFIVGSAIYTWGYDDGKMNMKAYMLRQRQADEDNRKYEYVLQDWDEPAKIVFRPKHDAIMPWKVIRYGAVLNGFHTEAEAKKWLAKKLKVKK